MTARIKIAAVQTDIKLMDPNYNLDKIISSSNTATKDGAQLIIFPECTLTGYVYTSREEAMPFMETIPGPSTDRLSSVCNKLGVHIVVGLLEKDKDKNYNSAALIGPDGLIGKYRKVHLPFLGIDRYLDSGNDPFRVFKTPIGNIGIHICYDCLFPECARVMALEGADIIVLPTNWPEGRGIVSQHIVIARAYENRVFLAAVNRVGIERGVRFIGKSKIISPSGQILSDAGDEDIILYSEVNLSEAREKRVVIKPGEFELGFMQDRKPELYMKICEYP
ncbi:MAG: carbon-nitrogen hydrolase family protein [Chloroflexi bacterium]|nr:carbon-nitrogen hydrolase family protein [Chloroflexota bacterium]